MTHSAQGEELRSFFARTPSGAELGALMEEQNALLEIKSGALAPQEQDRALTLQRLQAGNVRDELEAVRTSSIPGQKYDFGTFPRPQILYRGKRCFFFLGMAHVVDLADKGCVSQACTE